MKLEMGYLHAKKIGDAEAFGFYERTPSLPQAAKEDPGSSFIPSSMDGEDETSDRGRPRRTGRYVIEPAPRPEASLDRRWRAATRNPR